MLETGAERLRPGLRGGDIRDFANGLPRTSLRNCLKIPERLRSELLRVVKTHPAAPFRYLEYR
jgi:hypothetical protein